MTAKWTVTLVALVDTQLATCAGKELSFYASVCHFHSMIYDSVVLGLDDSLLESAARCLDAESVRALGGLQLGETAKARLDLLARKANEGQLTPDEAREYDRFIELGDILATLRLKAERQLGSSDAR